MLQQHCPLPSPMTLALCVVHHDELHPRPSVPFSHYKRRPPPLVFFTPVHSPPLTYTPTHSRSKASSASPEFHRSLPLQRRRGAVDWSRPRRSCQYQENYRRRL